MGGRLTSERGNASGGQTLPQRKPGILGSGAWAPNSDESTGRIQAQKALFDRLLPTSRRYLRMSLSNICDARALAKNSKRNSWFRQAFPDFR
jgi:hypothetical protein